MMLRQYGRACGIDITWSGLACAHGRGERSVARASATSLPFPRRPVRSGHVVRRPLCAARRHGAGGAPRDVSGAAARRTGPDQRRGAENAHAAITPCSAERSAATAAGASRAPGARPGSRCAASPTRTSCCCRWCSSSGSRSARRPPRIRRRDHRARARRSMPSSRRCSRSRRRALRLIDMPARQLAAGARAKAAPDSRSCDVGTRACASRHPQLAVRVESSRRASRRREYIRTRQVPTVRSALAIARNEHLIASQVDAAARLWRAAPPVSARRWRSRASARARPRSRRRR